MAQCITEPSSDSGSVVFAETMRAWIRAAQLQPPGEGGYLGSSRQGLFSVRCPFDNRGVALVATITAFWPVTVGLSGAGKTPHDGCGQRMHRGYQLPPWVSR